MTAPVEAVEQLIEAERRAQVLVLRRRGMHYNSIAKQLGLAPNVVKTMVEDTLKELGRDAGLLAQDLRALENARLDAWQLRLERDSTVPLDRKVNTLVRLSERRAKMNGYDAPLEIAGPNGGAIPITVGDSPIDALMRKIEKMFGIRPAPVVIPADGAEIVPSSPSTPLLSSSTDAPARSRVTVTE